MGSAAQGRAVEQGGCQLIAVAPPLSACLALTMQTEHRWRLEGSEARAAKLLRRQLGYAK